MVTVFCAIGARHGEPIMDKCKVGDVQSVDDGRGDFDGVGFVLYDQTGRPCVTFGYSDPAHAATGHGHVKAALENVEYVGAATR